MPKDLGYRPRPAKRKRAANDSGPRKAGSIHYVVLHSTEGGNAAGVAAFFASTAKASTQLVIDDADTFICVPDLVIPWGAPGVNSSGLHIEHCGFARWSRNEWMAHSRMLDESARRAAMWAWQYGIPLELLTPARLAAGKSGFCTHATASAAFKTAGGHTDPGSSFPLTDYMEKVSVYLRRIEADRGR